MARFTDRWAWEWDTRFTDNAAARWSITIAPVANGRFSLSTLDGVLAIIADSPEALQWALIVASQLTDHDLDGVAHLHRVKVLDAPRFSWRGVHLDIARHFFTALEISRLIELAAEHRLNVLHLHLSDDQGFRVEVPGRAPLVEVGSRRQSTPLGHHSEQRDDEIPVSGHLTQREVHELVHFARERFITLMPELDLPGHCTALLAAYPELSAESEPLEVATRWGIYPHALNLEPSTFQFADALLSYLGEAFDSPYVHIGGDECPTTPWEQSPLAMHRARELGANTPEEIQGIFTRHFVDTVEQMTGTDGIRRRAVAWDEVLDHDAPESTVIMAWRHSSRGALAARRGHDVVMAPMQFTYLDWPQSDSPTEPVALTSPPIPTTLEKCWRFNVIPPDLEPDYHYRILGAQAQLWTEYIATMDHLEYMAFPRLCALAEAMWGSPRQEYIEFTARLRTHLERLDAMGVHYRALDDPAQ